MSINRAELLALPIEAKLELVELLWDNLGDQPSPLPIPPWAIAQAKQRQNEMKADPTSGVSQQEIWRRVAEHRNG
ncbi:MAG: addiction module protein [Planctomycetes bacterium]|nr:addiction module protein [Planctomycetota bacterium]